MRDTYIQDECMAHEEDMLAFEYDSQMGRPGQGRRRFFAEDGGSFSRRALACLMH